MIDFELTERRILQHLHQRLTHSFTLHAPVLLNGDDDDLFPAMHCDPLGPFGFRLPHKFTEAGLRILQSPFSPA